MAADNQERDRKSLTFSQAEGLEPLPEPLKPGEISRELRSILWREIYVRLERSVPRGQTVIVGSWRAILSGWHVEAEHNPIDEFVPQFNTVASKVKLLVFEGSWNQVFDFLLYVMRHHAYSGNFLWDVNHCLERSRAAYVVVPDPPTFMPRATEEEGAAIVEALRTLDTAGLGGARAHLIQAGERLNAGDYADAVRESIHAVESVARKLDPKASTTLGPALAALEKRMAVHPALKAGFSKIYGYTSDQEGIRHPILDEAAAQVDLEDAVFMIGACAVLPDKQGEEDAYHSRVKREATRKAEIALSERLRGLASKERPDM